MLTQIDMEDLLEQYQNGPVLLSNSLLGISEEDLERALAPGKWTIRQIVAHLADTEISYTFRLRKILAEKTGLLTVFEQDQWVSELSANQIPVAVSVKLIQALRDFNFIALQQLPPERFLETGIHETDGTVSAYQLLQKVTDHLVHHVDQIDALRNTN